MAYIIIRNAEHLYEGIKFEYRFYTTTEELEILKIANSICKNYEIISNTNPETIELLIDLFGVDSFIDQNRYSTSTSLKNKLLYTFCRDCIPEYLDTLKINSYLINTEITLLKNDINYNSSCNFPYYYSQLLKITKMIKLQEYREKINKDIYNIISTYIIFPSIGYSQTGFPSIGYPRSGDEMRIPLTNKTLILNIGNEIYSKEKEYTINTLILTYQTIKHHILSFMDINNLELMSVIYVTEL